MTGAGPGVGWCCTECEVASHRAWCRGCDLPGLHETASGADHPRHPPGLVLCPAQTRVASRALADAIAYRLERAGGGCADCGHGPARACPDHLADIGRALAYRRLAAALARALPEMAGEGG